MRKFWVGGRGITPEEVRMGVGLFPEVGLWVIDGYDEENVDVVLYPGLGLWMGKFWVLDKMDHL